MPEFPPIPGEITMDELMDLARRLSAHPENAPGSDKTWVLERMRRFQAITRVRWTCVSVGGVPVPPETSEQTPTPAPPSALEAPIAPPGPTEPDASR